MENSYIESGNNYTEKVIALEDYEFGKVAKFSIPSLVPFMSKTDIDTTNFKVTLNKIKNKDKTQFKDNIGFTMTNYIELLVPLEMSDYQSLYSDINNNISEVTNNLLDILKKLKENPESVVIPDNIGIDKDYKINGKKGDMYIISFIGGNMNSAKIIGKVRE